MAGSDLASHRAPAAGIDAERRGGSMSGYPDSAQASYGHVEDIAASRYADQRVSVLSRVTIHISSAPSTDGSFGDEISASTHHTSRAATGDPGSRAATPPRHARVMRCSTPGADGSDSQCSSSADLASVPIGPSPEHDVSPAAAHTTISNASVLRRSLMTPPPHRAAVPVVLVPWPASSLSRSRTHRLPASAGGHPLSTGEHFHSS